MQILQLFHCMYLSALASSMAADDLASKKSSPMSLMSSVVMTLCPEILAEMAAGARSCTANLEFNGMTI